MKKSSMIRFRLLALAMVLGLAAGNGLWGWGGKPHAVDIRVPLKGIKEIQIIAFPDTKDTADNYVVWGEPRFLKKIS